MSGPAAATPRWLLLAALRRIVLAVIVGWLGAYLIAAGTGFHNAYSAVDERWALSARAAGYVAVAVFEVELIYYSLKEAAPALDWQSVLGLWPVRRRGLLAGLAGVSLVLMFGVEPLLGGALDVTSWGNAPEISLVDVVTAVLLAPLGEELFFRGWLWTGLRRHWGVRGTAVATALPWLLIHLGAGWQLPVVLLPMAALLSVTREYCGTRGTILLHVLNNGIITGLTALLAAG